MRMLALLAIAAAFVATPAVAQTGGLQVTPVVIEMPAQRGVTSFRMHNGRERETAFEVEAFVWTQDNGETVLTPTNDLIVAPTTFLVAANGDQIVRLALPPALRGGEDERAYRIVVRELPNPEAPATGFRMIIEMSMPVFVTPRNARGHLVVRRTRDEHGQPAVLLQNTGNARLQLSPDAAAGVENPPRYLLPGASAVRPVIANTLRLWTASAGDIEPHLAVIELSDAPVLADAR